MLLSRPVSRQIFGLRLLGGPGVRLVVLALLAVVVLAFRAIQLARLTGQIQWGYDFSAYWAAAGRLIDRASPYSAAQLAGSYAPQQQYLYLYPPPLAAAAEPFALLFPTDYRLAAWFWTALGALILLTSALALWRSERLGERFATLAGNGRWLLVAAAFAFPPVVGELVLGNVHLVLLGLLTLAWLGIRRGNGQGEWVAGVAVGIAAVIKVFPGLLLLWFLVTGRYRASAGVAVGALVAAALALPLTGIQPWLDYPAVLANLSAPSDTTDTLAPTVWLAAPIGFTAARILVTTIGLALVAWSAWTARGRGPAEAGGRRSAEVRSFAIAVTVSVLIAPALYHHYLALLVLPLVLGLAAGVPVVWLAVAYFLMWGGQQNALGDLSWLVNRAMPTAGALVLLGVLAWPLRGYVRRR